MTLLVSARQPGGLNNSFSLLSTPGMSVEVQDEAPVNVYIGPHGVPAIQRFA